MRSISVMKFSSLTSTSAWLLSLVLKTNARVLSTPTVTLACPNHGLRYNLAAQVTPAPRVPELRPRQTDSATDALATCGFINGDADKAVTCGSSLFCATTSTFVGCCEVSNCREIFTTCFDVLGDTCDQSCQNNPENLVCPSSLPYCARYNYEGESVGLGCALVSGYTSTVLLTVATTGPSILTTPAPTSTEAINSSSTANTHTVSSSLSTGATAGIAVGAAVGTLAVALGVFCFWRRSKKSKRGSEAIVERPGVVKEAVPVHQDRDSKAISELPHSPRTPMSLEFQQQGYYSGHSSPGPPHYSQHVKNPLYEMDAGAGDRPISYATTELGSGRD